MQQYNPEVVRFVSQGRTAIAQTGFETCRAGPNLPKIRADIIENKNIIHNSIKELKEALNEWKDLHKTGAFKGTL